MGSGNVSQSVLLADDDQSIPTATILQSQASAEGSQSIATTMNDQSRLSRVDNTTGTKYDHPAAQRSMSPIVPSGNTATGRSGTPAAARRFCSVSIATRYAPLTASDSVYVVPSSDRVFLATFVPASL